MNKKLKYFLLLLALIMIFGQFIKPQQNISEKPSPNDISAQYEVPTEVDIILKKACMDCHSNHTNYPSYANIFPVSWYLYNHIYGGKKHLDFSEFKSYSAKKQKHKLEEIVEVMDNGEMPLKSYTYLHPEAKLDKDELKSLISWVKGVESSIIVE